MMNVMGHCSCGAHSCAAEKKVDAKVSVFHEYGKVIFSLLLLAGGIIMVYRGLSSGRNTGDERSLGKYQGKRLFQ